MIRTLLEICVEDVAGVEAAAAGGADRLELCSALALGGLSPSLAFATVAMESGLTVHAMVRPRAGDFVYTGDELALMAAEIRMLASVGIAGVVVGATQTDGSPDREGLARLRDAAAGMAIVFHRAIDLALDPLEAVEMACALGYDHVLSSGGAATAVEGTQMLARMVETARGRVSIMAGSGVRSDNVVELVRATGVQAVHASAVSECPWSDPRIAALGFGPPSRRRTDAAKVADIRAALDEPKIPK